MVSSVGHSRGRRIQQGIVVIMHFKKPKAETLFKMWKAFLLVVHVSTFGNLVILSVPFVCLCSHTYKGCVSGGVTTRKFHVNEVGIGDVFIF